MTDDIDEIVLTREGIADLIRNEYDKAPDYWLAREKWDDGAERIADTILAALDRLIAERDSEKRHAENCTFAMVRANDQALEAMARAEAAEAEIGRLREQVERLKSPARDCYHEEACPHWVEANNEIERLRQDKS